MRYLEIDTGLKRTRCASKLVEIMPCLLVGKTLLDRVGAQLVLATLLLKIVVAPLRILRSAPHRSAPTSAASLRTLTRYRHTDIEITDIHLTPSHVVTSTILIPRMQ